MPTRRPAGRVAKIRPSKNMKDLTPAAQEQVLQYAQAHDPSSQQANSGFDVQSGFCMSMPTSCNTSFGDGLNHNGAELITNGGPIGGTVLHGSPYGSSQALAFHQSATMTGSQPGLYPPLRGNAPIFQPDTLPSTSGAVATAVYGDRVNIESGLCRKLASNLAIREPVQRRAEQALNLDRRGNVEALLAHISGVQATRPCKNCYKGHGPWTTCVTVEGQMCNSCTNCWFNASGSRCTFQENENQIPPMIMQSSSAPALMVSVPAPTPVVTPVPLPVPVRSSTQPANPYPLPVAPSAQDSFTSESPEALQMEAAPIWHTSVNTEAGPDRFLARAYNEVAQQSQLERKIAEVEALAKKYALRKLELDAYLQTPEGLTEHHDMLQKHGDRLGRDFERLVDQHSSGDSDI